MRYYHTIFLLLLMQPFFCYSINPVYSTCSFLNTALAKGYHSLGKVIWKYNDAPLSDKHEQFARTVAQEISVGQTLQFYKLPSSQAKIGPHCVGNHIYLDERDFKHFAHDKHALRFVIAHEIMHIEKFHHLKKIAVAISACALILYLMKKLSQTSPIKEKVAASYFLAFAVGLTTMKIVEFALRALSRRFEREADLKAIEQLSRNNRQDLVKTGALEYLSRFKQEPLSWWKKVTSSHPPIAERLAYIQNFNL